jgi:ATP-dependent DNA helicase RecG
MKTQKDFLQDVDTLPGVGPTLKSKLANLNIRTVADCLFHLPLRYQDRTRIYPIATLRPGDHAVIEGSIVSAEIRKGKRQILSVQVTDGSAALTLSFFHFHPNQVAKLIPGTRIRCFGEVRLSGRVLGITHPEYTLGATGAMPEVQDCLTPIYPLTEGLSQAGLRKVLYQALLLLKAYDIADFLPSATLATHQFPTLKEALLFLHEPPPDAPLSLLETGQHPAQQRLAFEELCAHHLSLLSLRLQEQHHTAPVCADLSLHDAFLKSLPFKLTGAQQRVIDEIRVDMSRHTPMLRLIQGDVGSGKTAVAAAAMALCVASGHQAALMAPTEILAEQHVQQFKAWFEPLGITVEWLAGKLTPKHKQEISEKIAQGDVQIIIGTHALVQETVSFQKLGLVIIDEQHRFGVEQRLALTAKGKSSTTIPHQLFMTATPIPRTLAMTAYADLDCSIIDELPPGRQPIITTVMSNDKRQLIMDRIYEACRAGKQVYWVCTLIDDSETITAQAASIIADQLCAAMPDIAIGLIHGKMRPTDKEAVMLSFVSGDLKLLVATTVIEVGVNVPNASLMIIENPERLGLSQLHQLRGRVGRGSEQSYCVLLYHPPLSYTAGERLDIMRKTNDGFVIAEKDLALRGAGEWLGTRQTGIKLMRIADIIRDRELIPFVKPCAQALMHSPEADALITRWLGAKLQYAGA